MACDITAGGLRACKTSLGGNSVIYLYPQTLSITLKVQDVASNAQLNLLSASFGHAVIADRNGNHKVVGLTDGIDWSIEATSGGAKTDSNLYTLTGVSTENLLSPTLDSATQAAFLAVVA